MHKAQTAKPALGDPNALEIGQLYPAVITDHDILDVSLAIDQSPNLPSRLMRKLTKLARELGTNNLVGLNSARVELFNPTPLVWL